jgi:tetratricopeptide (TPR) repeat protein
MNKERLTQLLTFLKEEPNDPFILYAIATEYSQDEPGKALEYYEKLLSEHENYVATYYHAARLYADLAEREKAENTFLKGIEIAKAQNESLAKRELQNAYHEFLYEDE